MLPRNLLAQETSPYLLQHKDNPVHWRPWGEPALAEAKRLDRPILLSIGYAACHWCHVMAHESFEDASIAALMNELFVNIKLDREERPDIDALYQAALAMLGEQGGWPLTMFLTPHGEPFWGGTYFPPTARYGRPGFREVLAQIAQVYREQKDKVAKNVAALRQGLTKLSTRQPGSGITPAMLDDAAMTALRLVDPIRGGTAGAPKFPQPVFFRLLWRAYRRTRAPMFREAVTLTLDALCKGGIYDHLGGGFARYSTDAEWLVPHFEKMLYDNALLINLLSEVWTDTRATLYRRRVRETIDWAMAEMRIEHPSGDGTFAFASALDADSEGVEGKYYVWTADEIDRALGTDAAAFKRAYGVEPGGNWEGHTILNLSDTPDLDAILADSALADARAKLKARRDGRVRPGRDDKVLADWNGLMIAALARAATAFDQPAWLDTARRVFDFVVAHMHDGGRLRHVWCGGGVQRHPALIEDYANLARAALALFEATGEDRLLAQARAWVGAADRHHWDPAGAGYFQSADDTTDVIARSKAINDHAVASGNGTMVDVLARLYFHTGDDAYRERADALVRLFSGDNSQYLVSVPGLLCSAELLQRAVQVVVVGDRGSPAAAALQRAVFDAASPLLVVSSRQPNAPLPPTHPAFAKGLVDGQPAAYVCVGTTCSPPVTAPDDLRRQLAAL
jgi:uncharacterized protein YyaL (SSP411 family)